MMRFRVPRPISFLLASSALCACAAAPPGASHAQSPASSPSTADASPSAPAAQRGNPPATSPTVRPRLPEITLDPKAPPRPLPELKVENIGLHVGGGPNDAETKAPFLNAIAARFPAFMDCYRKNEDPVTGGRYGVDLHIARAGGHPRLEQPRTALRGPEFRACLSSVFESVEFQKPTHGPTTISYSLRFTLVDPP